jgi:hypothetical protein
MKEALLALLELQSQVWFSRFSYDDNIGMSPAQDARLQKWLIVFDMLQESLPGACLMVKGRAQTERVFGSSATLRFLPIETDSPHLLQRFPHHAPSQHRPHQHLTLRTIAVVDLISRQLLR